MSAVKVLVTTDGSNLSDKAVDTAVRLTKQFGGELIAVTAVIAPPPSTGFEGEDQAVRERLAAVHHKATEAGVPCEVVAEHCSAVWKGILECAITSLWPVAVWGRSDRSFWVARRRKSCIRPIVRCSWSAEFLTRS